MPQEILQSPEQEPIAVVEINAARHSIKAKTEREELSAVGMEEAVKAGSGGVHHESMMDALESGKTIDIYGSSRERTTQSSMLRMLSEHFKEVDFSTVDPKDLVNWIVESGQIRTIENDLLNFKMGEGEFYDKGLKAFMDKQYLKWLVEDSDGLAIETHQKADQIETLSTQAANVASFFSATGLAKAKEMIKIGDKKEHAFVTSHQGVLESFLYKVINMKESPELASEFVASLNNQGFLENQGYTVQFEMLENDVWGIKIKYNDKEYLLEPNDIDQIIREGLDLRDKLTPEDSESKN